MFERKPAKKVPRLVWRMSATSPAGEFVSPSAKDTNSPGPADAHERGFRASAWDLSNGLDLAETDLNTLPGELVDAFLKVGR